MQKNKLWFWRLLSNNRFWVLAVSVVLSVNIAGFIQLFIPSGSLQVIRIGQFYGFVSIVYLYFALLASPLTKVFPNLYFKEQYLHARRAIGVSAFYFALLHTYITFFKQLGGFSGIKYLDSHYAASILFGAIGLGILFIMSATSFNIVVDKLKFKNWKLLHRLVYIAVLSIIIHIVIIGPHYNNLNFFSLFSLAALIFLLCLELVRFILFVNKKSRIRK